MNLTTIRSRALRPHKRRTFASVAVEFALTLPIWVLLLLGTADVAYMMLLSQRVDRIAYSVTDIVTQSESLNLEDLNNILLAASQLMNPFPFGENGIVIVTSLYRPPGGATEIRWQEPGGGSLARSSLIGEMGTTPALPQGLTLNENENLIVAEVFYAFTPMFISANILDARDIYRYAVYKPRLGFLIEPPT